MKTSTFYCSSHKASVTVEHSDFTTGYGKDSRNRKHCFACCGKNDKKEMLKTGRAVLYLSERSPEQRKTHSSASHHITNWPGTLEFMVYGVRKGRHNIARTRYDVWFNVSDGHVWHGVQYGEWTQIVYCKRTKELWKD